MATHHRREITVYLHTLNLSPSKRTSTIHFHFLPPLTSSSAHHVPLSPITSIYPRPFFFFPPAAAFLAPGIAGPSRSSIELALLMLVPGLDGGPLGGPFPPLCALKLLSIAGGAVRPGPPGGADALGGAASPAPKAGPSSDPEPIREGGPAGLGALVGGPPVALAVLGGPAILGGGGVPVDFGVASAPAFLSTQRFKLAS